MMRSACLSLAAPPEAMVSAVSATCEAAQPCTRGPGHLTGTHRECDAAVNHRGNAAAVSSILHRRAEHPDVSRVSLQAPAVTVQ